LPDPKFPTISHIYSSTNARSEPVSLFVFSCPICRDFPLFFWFSVVVSVSTFYSSIVTFRRCTGFRTLLKGSCVFLFSISISKGDCLAPSMTRVSSPPTEGPREWPTNREAYFCLSSSLSLIDGQVGSANQEVLWPSSPSVPVDVRARVCFSKDSNLRCVVSRGGAVQAAVT